MKREPSGAIGNITIPVLQRVGDTGVKAYPAIGGELVEQGLLHECVVKLVFANTY